MRKILRVGTRTSPLALAQVREIAQVLKAVAPAVRLKIVGMDTAGDRDKKTPISEMEGTDFFTREIDRALLAGRIDLAVHSAKDLPDVVPEGIVIAATTRSVDPYDVLVSRDHLKLRELPKGARVGTSSERRKSQLRAYRPDLTIVDIRGTMNERLDKLVSEDLDAIVIAGAGLIRLGLGGRITERIGLKILKPHPLQGSLAVAVRKEDVKLRKLFSKLHRKKTSICVDKKTMRDTMSMRNLTGNMSFPHALSGNPGSGSCSGSPTKTFGDDNLKHNRSKKLPKANETAIGRKRILVTGTSTKRFEKMGEILHVPMIEIKPVKSFKRVDAALRRIDGYDGFLFTSRHAVLYFLDRLKKKMKNIRALRSKRVFAIGKTTAKTLKSFGLKAKGLPEEETAESMVKLLKKFQVKGKRFLIPRSDLARDLLVDALRKRGAHVDPLTVYRNVRPKIKKQDLERIDEIIFTSPSTVKNFLKIHHDIPARVKIWAIGSVTQAQLKTFKIRSEILKHGD